jgi:predicted Zn-dependent protease
VEVQKTMPPIDRIRRRAVRSALAGVALAIALVACAKAPVTGRNQLILLSESQDADMGLQAYQQIKQEEKVSTDPELTERVETVGERIAAVSPYPDWDWEFTLFDDPQPNAFALPGGKVGVYTGLFKVAKNDAQLAAVLAHEVGHALARHGAERMSQGLLTQLGGAAVGVATGSQAYVDAYSQLATLGVMLPYSRTQESEADEIGLMLMAKAGYDPREAIKLWQNFEALGGERPPEFLSTHPSEGTRIERLKELMPKALEIYEASRQQQ